MQQRSVGTVVAVVLLLVGVVHVGQARADGDSPAFKAFAPKGGGFEIAMPGTPKESTYVEKSAAGDVPSWKASVELSNRGFYAGYGDLPEATWKEAQPKVVERARDVVVTAAKGKAKLVADRKLKVAGKYQARDFKLVGDQFEMNQRAILVNHRLYQFSVIGAPGCCTDAEVQKYFNSFKLAK